MVYRQLIFTMILLLDFAKMDHEVVVLTTTPHYNVVEEQLKQQPMHRCMGGGFKESNFKGIRVIHVPQKKFKNTLLRLLRFCVLAYCFILLRTYSKKCRYYFISVPSFNDRGYQYIVSQIKRM